MEVVIQGPAGKLAGALWEPEGAPRGAAVLCHPHPAHGGTMDSNVLFRAARALQSAGLVVLRFDFRGVRDSEGEHAGEHGVDGAEEGDLVAALDWLGSRYPHLALWAGGFSFGARTAASLLAREPGRVEQVLLIALPVLASPCEGARGLDLPGLALMGGRDEFGDLDAFEAQLPELAARLELQELEDADHFFTGALDALQGLVRTWAERALQRQSTSR